MTAALFECLSKWVGVRSLLRCVPLVLATCLLAAPVTAQEDRQITDEEIDMSCGYAMKKSWETFVRYADQREFDVGALLYQSVCRMAITTNYPYDGNLWSASARYSGYVGDFVKYSSSHLLKSGRHDVWVALLTSENVIGDACTAAPWDNKANAESRACSRRTAVFYELVSAWENIPTKRSAVEYAAKVICLSIDRYNVQGLEDIRTIECMTPPFVFPPRD